MAIENKCIALQDIADDLDCLDNSGGILTAYLFYHKDVATWPDEPTNAVDLESFGKLTGDVAFKTGKNAIKFEITPDKGNFDITEVGETGGKSHSMELTLYRHGITPKILGFMGATKNAKLGAVVVDPNGNAYLMGDKFTGVYRNGGDGAKTGSARGDLAGAGFKFTYPVNNPRVYTGDIDLLTKPAANPA